MFCSNKISRIFGKFASHKFFPPVQFCINALYVAIFRISLKEFAPLKSYASLNALFTRALKEKRAINPNPSALISPCDALITELGKSKNKSVLQIKGMEYSLQELLAQKLDKELYYMNFYLSPRDYHRFHAPCDMEIYELRYFSGELKAVNMPSLRKNHNLFIRNERAVLVAKTASGKWLYFVAVGALNVGSIIMHCEGRLRTNNRANSISYTYRVPIAVKKGEELGMFQMGSTIVLLMEEMNANVEIGRKVRYGEDIGVH